MAAGAETEVKAVLRLHACQVHLSIQNFGKVQKIFAAVTLSRAFPTGSRIICPEETGNVASDFVAAGPDPGADGGQEMSRIAAESPPHFPNRAKQNTG